MTTCLTFVDTTINLVFANKSGCILLKPATSDVFHFRFSLYIVLLNCHPIFAAVTIYNGSRNNLLVTAMTYYLVKDNINSPAICMYFNDLA